LLSVRRVSSDPLGQPAFAVWFHWARRIELMWIKANADCQRPCSKTQTMEPVMRMRWRGLSVAMTVGSLLASGRPAKADLLSALDLAGSFGSTGGFTRYVPSVSNPLFNETPYITTELRAIYLHDDIPSSFVTSGGSIDAGAVQARVALTDRLGIIAPKDGFAELHFDKALADTNGFENLAFGLKYAVVSDPQANQIVTIGVTYEPPSGSLQTSGISMQGRGGGFFNPFVAAATSWGPFGIEGNVGTNLAVDSNHDSSMVHYAGHIDYELYHNLFGLFEMNGFSVFQNGNRTPGNFEGVDLVNFGSTAAGTVITAAFGLRYLINEHVMVGAAYERPVTNREDILGSRVTADLVLRY
jgi:hypothetical protein